MADALDQLRQLLEAHEPGPLSLTPEMERLLAEGWSALTGTHGGMWGCKLFGRMESVKWQPPLLGFRIERHGAFKMGSTRAEIQVWEVDLEKRTKSVFQ